MPPPTVVNALCLPSHLGQTPDYLAELLSAPPQRRDSATAQWLMWTNASTHSQQAQVRILSHCV